MKIITLETLAQRHPCALVDEDSVLPLKPVLAEHGVHVADTNALVEALPLVRPIIEDALGRGSGVVSISSGRIGPPVPLPRNIFLAGANYGSHRAEVEAHGVDIHEPGVIFFSKPAGALIGPRDHIVRPRGVEFLDYEAELAIVIGKRARCVAKEDAPTYVAGFLSANDVSNRLGFGTEQGIAAGLMDLMRAKGWETFLPTGPWLVTPDEAPPWNEIEIETRVNGKLRQKGSASDMMFDPYELVEQLSAITTLFPGDIISTGTPGGVGVALDPPRFLEPGDVVEIRLTGLGVMENEVRDAEQGD